MREYRHYRARWEIDVTAVNPVTAAQLAQKFVQNPETTATVFDVTQGFNGKRVYRVDLRGRSVQVLKVTKKRWHRVPEERVQLVFGKRCACHGVPDEQVWVDYAVGVPICEECGDDYAYERTQVLR